MFYKNWMKVPSVSFNLVRRGYYNIQVRVSWFLGGRGMTSTTPQAQSWWVMNTPGDYGALGDASVYTSGYCYVP